MGLTAFLIVFAFFVVSFLINRKIVNLNVLFNLLWAVLIFVSHVINIGITKPTDEFYKIVIMGTVTFNVVAFILSALRALLGKHMANRKQTTNSASKLRKNIFIVLQIILLLYYLVKLLNILSFFASGGSYQKIRGYYFSDRYLTSNFEYLMITYVFDPIITVTQIVLAVNFLDRQYNKWVMVVMAANVFLRAFVSAGRMILFEMILVFVFVYFVQYRKTGTVSKGKKIFLLFFCLVSALLAVYISFGRSGEQGGIVSSAAETLIVNFTGSFRYFSVLLNKNVFLPSQTYGLTTFAGITDIFTSLFRFTGLTNADVIQNSIGVILDNFRVIGKFSYNAMPTMYYFFITDFGNAGVIIGSSVLATISFIFQSMFRNKKTYKRLALYLLAALIIFESPMIWLPFRTSFVMSFVYVILFVDNRYISEKNNY